MKEPIRANGDAETARKGLRVGYVNALKLPEIGAKKPAKG